MTRRAFFQAVPITFVVGGVGTYSGTFEVFVGDYVRHRTEGWVFYITDTVDSNQERRLLAEVLQGHNYQGQELFQEGTFITVVGAWKTNDYEKITKEEWERSK